MLTRNKDADYEIMYKLNDYDLGNICQLNKYSRQLCKDDFFWMNRTFIRFAPIFTIEQLKHYKTKYGFDTWRKYYINMIDFIEKYYSGENVKGRNDITILSEYIYGKTRRLFDYFTDCNGNCNFKLLEEDFIDLNELFIETLKMSNSELSRDEKWKILSSIIKIPRFKIDKYIARNFYNHFGIEAFMILLKERNSKSLRKLLLSTVLDLIKENSKKVLEDISPYIESGDEILETLFENINIGNYINRNNIYLFLEKAVKKGSTRYDIERAMKEENINRNKLSHVAKDNYDYSIKVLKTYLKIRS